MCEACYKTKSKLPGRFNQQHTPDHKFELDELHMLRNTLLRRASMFNIAQQRPEVVCPYGWWSTWWKSRQRRGWKWGGSEMEREALWCPWKQKPLCIIIQISEGHYNTRIVSDVIRRALQNKTSMASISLQIIWLIRSFCSLLPQTKKIWNLPHLRHIGGATEKWRNPGIDTLHFCVMREHSSRLNVHGNEVDLCIY